MQTSPDGEHKVEGKAERVGFNNSSPEGSFSAFILGPKSLITSSATKGAGGGARGVRHKNSAHLNHQRKRVSPGDKTVGAHSALAIVLAHFE